MRSMPASRELDVEEMSSASSVRYNYMSRAELWACCGKKHGNSITANKKDNEGRWKTKSKKQLMVELKNAAMPRSKSGGSNAAFWCVWVRASDKA